MATNIKRRFTVDLEISTGDAEKKIKATVGNLKTILADLGKASDKMTYFKELTDYLSQVDAQLGAFKKKHGEGVFNKIFDGLDANLRKGMEDTFNTAREQLAQLEQLKEKVSKFDANTSKDELKATAQEIKDLYAALGASDKLNLAAGNAKATTQIEKMRDALEGFAIVWEDVNSKIARGFTFGGTGSGGGVGGPSNKIQEEIDKLKKQKEEFQKILAAFNNPNLKVNTTKKNDVAQLEELIQKYKEAQAVVTRLETAKNTKGEEYKKAIAEAVQLATLLKNTMDYVSANGSAKGDQLVVSQVGANGAYTLAEDFLKRIKGKDIFKEARQYIEQQAKLIDDKIIEIQNRATESSGSGLGTGVGGQIDQNRNLGISYDELSNKLKEYLALQKKLDEGATVDDNGQDIQDQIYKLDEYFDSLGKTKEEIGKIQDIISNFSFGDFGIDEAINQLSQFLTIVKDIKGELSSGNGSNLGSGTGNGSGNGTGNGGNGTSVDIDFSSLEKTLKSEMSTLAGKLDNVLKVELVKDSTDIQNAINNIRDTVNNIKSVVDTYKASKEADAKQAEVENMKQNLLQLLDVVNKQNAGRNSQGEYQGQELSAAILSDGSISVNYGEKGTVPWNKMAESLVGNLTKTLIADIHSHPLHELWDGSLFDKTTYVSDMFSGSSGDLGAFKFSKELGAQVAGMITGNILRTLDLSKLTPELMTQFRKELAKIEKQYISSGKYDDYVGTSRSGGLAYNRQDSLEGQHKVTEVFENMMYDAFAKVGYSRDKVNQEIFKKYNLTDDKQLTELATYLVNLSNSAEKAISPIDRLSDIVMQFGGDALSKKADTVFEAYNKGELKASDVFNQLVPSYHIDEASIKSLMSIDNANKLSPIESILTNITTLLSTISNSINSIETNTQKNATEKIDTVINDIVGFRNGLRNDNLINSGQSIYNPANITEYYTQDVWNRAVQALDNFKNDVENNALGIKETPTQNLIDQFKTVLTYINDASKQIELYTKDGRDFTEPRYGSLVNDASDLIDELKQPLDAFVNVLLERRNKIQSDLNDTNSERRTDSFYNDFTDTQFNNADISSFANSISLLTTQIEELCSLVRSLDFDQLNNSERTTDNAITETKNTSNLPTQDYALEVTLQKTNGILEQISNSILNNEQSQDDSELTVALRDLISQLEEIVSIVKAFNPEEKPVDGVKPDGATENPTQEYAFDATLQKTNGILDKILVAIGNNESLAKMVEPLSAAVTELKNVANGIVQEQKARKSDTSVAQARIANNDSYTQIKSIALGSLGDRALDSDVTQMKALANGIVQVTGWIKTAEDAWEGFTVKVDEAGKASSLTFDKNAKAAKQAAAQAKALQKAAEGNGDTNPYVYDRAEVEKRAQKHLDELTAQGKQATVQFKDSGRYTITILEEIDGLSKQIFQTFDENDEKIERTTATVSNDQKIKLENLKSLIETGATDKFISDKDTVYQQYQKANEELEKMNSLYRAKDNLENEDIATWNAQIKLVQQLASDVEKLIQKRKVAVESEAFKSDRGKKLSKYDLDLADLKTKINIPNSFNQQLEDARKAIESAADSDSLKIAVNNWEALKNQIKQTATEQDLFIKKSKETKDTTPDKFTKNLDSQKNAFAKYKVDLGDISKLSQETQDKLQQLENDLNNISDVDGLNQWVKSFSDLKTEITNTQKITKNKKSREADTIAGQAKAKFKELDFDTNAVSVNTEQQNLLNLHKKLIDAVDEYKTKVGTSQEIEIDGLKQIQQELFNAIEAYKQKNNIINVNGKSQKAYGTGAVLSATGKYNMLKEQASSAEFDGSGEITKRLNQYTAAYQKLLAEQKKVIAIQNQLKPGESLTNEQLAGFKQAQMECNKYATELNKVINANKKFAESLIESDRVNEDFEDNIKGRKKALLDYVQVKYPTAEVGKFDAACEKLTFTVNNGNGTFTQMTAAINPARNAIGTIAGETEKATTAFGRFFDELKGKAKSIFAYLISSMSMQEVWQQIRQGVQYVREIDSALTELKKVTDETDVSYNKFLKTMSQTAGIVGSTTADLTRSAADWARLNI